MKLKKTRESQGFTLTEVVLTLGIVGLVLGAIWTATGTVYRSRRVDTTITQILHIVNGLRSFYPPSQTTVEGTLNAAMMKPSGISPSDMIISGSNANNLTNVWGSDVIVSGNNGPTMTITYNNIPSVACARLLMSLTDINRDTGLKSIQGITAFPISATIATNTCSNPANNVIFVFNLR